jgi:formylmethanofuran dehydrogenase subunit B
MVVCYSQNLRPTWRPEATQGEKEADSRQSNKHQGYPDGKRQAQDHKHQQPIYVDIIRTQFSHSSSEYTNTPENQESVLKSYLMKIIEYFKDINNSLKEMQENM